VSDATICTGCAAACPGECNRAHRQDPTIPPIPGQPVWCPECRTHIRHALYAIPKLYAHLELDKHRATRTPGEKLGGSKEKPSPSGAADEQNALTWLLTYWEDTIREHLDYAPRPRRLAAGVDRWPVSWCHLVSGPAEEGEPWPIVVTSTVTAEMSMSGPASVEVGTLNGAAQFLNAHIDWALTNHPLALELGRDILRARKRAQTATKTNPQRRRMPIPCPRCDLKTLVHEGGTDHITCGNTAECGRILSMDEYDDLATSLAKSQRKGYLSEATA